VPLPNPGISKNSPARRWISDIHVIALDCPDELRRTRINARPPWRSRYIEEQVEFSRWLRGTIADRIDTSGGTPEHAAAAIADPGQPSAPNWSAIILARVTRRIAASSNPGGAGSGRHLWRLASMPGGLPRRDRKGIGKP
jgi:hypothetical protein